MNGKEKLDWGRAVTAARLAPHSGMVMLDGSTVLALAEERRVTALDATDAQRYRTVRAAVTDPINGADQIATASAALGLKQAQYPTPEQFDQIIDRVAIERSGESS